MNERSEELAVNDPYAEHIVQVERSYLILHGVDAPLTGDY